jgi:hypothetical protein
MVEEQFGKCGSEDIQMYANMFFWETSTLEIFWPEKLHWKYFWPEKLVKVAGQVSKVTMS